MFLRRSAYKLATIPYLHVLQSRATSRHNPLASAYTFEDVLPVALGGRHHAPIMAQNMSFDVSMENPNYQQHAPMSSASMQRSNRYRKSSTTAPGPKANTGGFLRSGSMRALRKMMKRLTTDQQNLEDQQQLQRQRLASAAAQATSGCILPFSIDCLQTTRASHRRIPRLRTSGQSR